MILIATGSYSELARRRAQRPERLYDSDSILQMDRIPKSLAVVGAGVIGCEYATMFRALGVEVALICGTGPAAAVPRPRDRRAPEDADRAPGAATWSCRTSRRPRSALDDPDWVRLRLKSGEELDVERVLFATGRMGATEGLGLEQRRAHGRAAAAT